MALPHSRPDREREKFVETTAGDTAVRVVIADGSTGGGGASNQLQATYAAGETISAVKAIRVDVATAFLAEPGTFINAAVTGISLTAGNLGDDIKAVLSGEFYDSSFSFTAGDLLYLGTSGTITNVAPVSGFRTVIGRSIGGTGIIVDIEEPIAI
jgi:hypothetical protein